MTVIRVRDITGSNTLAGKSGGLRDFPKFVAAIEAVREASTVFLDWSDVELATASYFGATLVPLLRMTIAGDLDRYLIVGGLNQTCLDELKLVLEHLGLVVLLGDLSRKSAVRSVSVLGKLDTSYAEAFAAVQKAHGASAAELHARQGRTGTRIGRTGWIKRLTNLHRLRLVKKQRSGREYVFQSIS
jgi:hypothetical protein